VKACRAFQYVIQNSLFKKKKFYKAVIKRICEIQERTFYKQKIKIKVELKTISESLQI
jgi:hypothetical protein